LACAIARSVSVRGGHPDDVLRDWRRLGRGDLSDIGLGYAPEPIRSSVGGRLGYELVGVVVGEVGLGDGAVAFIVDRRGLVLLEPFLGGDPLRGFGVVGVPRGQLGLGAFGGGAGTRGVRKPPRPGVVKPL
jgi:hypothetical protein